MCKAKSCIYWKSCAVKRECMDFHCGDYLPDPKKLEEARKRRDKED